MNFLGMNFECRLFTDFLNVQICFNSLDLDMDGYDGFGILGVKMVGVWARMGFVA
jgi:hypothetical protein